jgi:hypothetical protein
MATKHILTASGSEFRLTDIGGGHVEIERMGLAQLNYHPFAIAAAISDITVGRPVTGHTVDGDLFTTSEVREVRDA